MFTLAQRYLIASFVPPFLGGTLFFVAFLLALQLFRIIRIMIQKNVEGEMIFLLMGDISLSLLSSAVPLAVFIAALRGLRRRSQDMEVVALHALGLSLRQLLAPFLFLALLIGATLFVLQMDVVPKAKFRFRNTVIKLTNRGLLSDIKGGMFFTDIPNLILFAEEVKGENKAMERVFISRQDGEFEQYIFAEKGYLVKEFKGDLAPPSLRLYLDNGNMMKTSRSEGKMEKILFKEYDFPISSKFSLPDSITKDSMRNQRELRGEIRKKRKEIQERPDFRRFRRDLSRSLLEYWLRWQYPLQSFVFMFWGISFGINTNVHERRSRSGGGGGIFLSLVGYHVLLLTAIALARKEVLDPFVAVLAPNTLAALVVTWRLGGAQFFARKFKQVREGGKSLPY